jgi:hypothetical protein
MDRVDDEMRKVEVVSQAFGLVASIGALEI